MRTPKIINPGLRQHYREFSVDEKTEIYNYWATTRNNNSKDVAAAFNTTVFVVDRILNDHFKLIAKNI